MVEINLGVHDYFDALKEIAFLIERTNSIAYRIEAKDIGELRQKILAIKLLIIFLILQTFNNCTIHLQVRK